MAKYKTARCVLQRDDHFLLAVHSRFFRQRPRKWGLLGGGIEWGEAPDIAVRRELREEIELDLQSVQHVGVFDYKRARHVVFHADTDQHKFWYDEKELVDIGWFSLPEISRLYSDNLLHAGYELDAIERAVRLRQESLGLTA